MDEWLYNPFLVYCRELASGTVSLTCDRAQGDDSKHDSHYSTLLHNITPGKYIVIKVEYGLQLHFKIFLRKNNNKNNHKNAHDFGL